MRLHARLLPGSRCCTSRAAKTVGSAHAIAIVKRKEQKQGLFHNSPPRRRKRGMTCGKTVQRPRQKAGEINGAKMISCADQCCESHRVLIAATTAAAAGAGHSPSAARPSRGVSRMRSSHWLRSPLKHPHQTPRSSSSSISSSGISWSTIPRCCCSRVATRSTKSRHSGSVNSTAQCSPPTRTQYKPREGSRDKRHPAPSC